MHRSCRRSRALPRKSSSFFIVLAFALSGALALAAEAPPPLPAPAAKPAQAPAQAPTAAPVPAKTLDFGTLLATLNQKVTLAAQPSLPEPKLPPKDDASRGGFSAKAPVGGADQGRVDFPLQHTRVFAQVSGNVARVEVQQLYRNPSANRLEAVYAFPLPANAAVTEMYFRIGSRIVYGEVKKREEAKATYEQAKSEGKTAALTEQERPNLFTQSVANIPPGETIAVVLRYVHEVPYADGRYLFHFPTTVGPRYMPVEGVGGPAASAGVPDAARLSPPLIRDGHGPADLELMIRLSPGGAFREVASKNHRVVSGIDGEGGRLVALAEDDRVPNKDFVLAYQPVGAQPDAHVLAQRERGEDYLMLFVQPPAQVNPADVRPKELVYLIDKSGSMMGEPIETAKALILQSLHRMGPLDTFQLIAFDGAAYEMSPAPLGNTEENVANAEKWLGSLSGGGGTEMLTGILAALTPPSDPSRLRMVVFCTDGYIGNEREIIDAVGKHRGSARVFGFGIGSSVNRYLIEGVASAGRGASEVVLNGANLDEAVAQLFKRIDRPVLTDLSLSFSGLEVSEVYPQYLPDLFAGQPLVVVGKYRDGGKGGPATVELKGKLGTRPYSKKMTLELSRTADAQPTVGTLWARRKIDDLTFRHPGSPNPEEIEQITGLGLKFKLVTAYTSFVAVERTLLVDPKVPLTQVLVPNELPAGVSPEGVFAPQNTEVQVLPSRVKPGDPELRVRAPRGTTAVRVTLPFEGEAREARRDPVTGEFVLRFLVPSGWPDGSYDARIELDGPNGTAHQTAPIRVDTTPAAITILAAPRSVEPGKTFTVALKPALPLTTVAGLIARPTAGGLGQALKGAMEVKEVMVRAPWGQIVLATMDGPLGAYTAELEVPAGWPRGAVELEVVASDTAGNVSRRGLDLRIGAPSPLDALDTVLPLAAVALCLGAVARQLWRSRSRRRAGLAPALAVVAVAVERS